MYVECDWGDGEALVKEYLNLNTTEMESFSNFETYFYYHNFTSAGDKIINCTLQNNVSTYDQLFANLTLYDHIIDFKAIPKYVAYGEEDLPNPTLMDAMGVKKDQIPINKNVTLTFEYSYATIEEITVLNSSSEMMIGKWPVPDKFNAKSFTVSFTIEVEGFVNLTIVAKNQLENVSFDLTVEMVGQIRGMELDDRGIVSRKNEAKKFYIDLESVGSGSCFKVEFDDGIEETIGAKFACEKFYPNIPFKEVKLTIPIIFEHIYSSNGLYNVSLYGQNLVTDEVFSQLPIVVSDSFCQQPVVYLPKNSTNPERPLTFYRTDTIQLTSTVLLNCSDVLTTKKHWDIKRASVDFTNGNENLTLLTIGDMTDASWQKPQVSFNPNTFEYGLHKICFWARMWDFRDNGDPALTHLLPFERSACTYVEIKPTPLVTKLTEGGTSVTTRGVDQTVELKAYLYTFDPDMPDDKVKNN